MPILGPRLGVADTLSLNMRFPKLYVPADFVKLSLDWNTHGGIGESIFAGSFHHMHETVPMQLENMARPLSFPSTELPSDTPKFTYCEPPVTTPIYDVFGAHPYASPPPMPPKPIKFNARVIISVGFKESEVEKIDHQYTRKLRLLCGRRKGAIMLLGKWILKHICLFFLRCFKQISPILFYLSFAITKEGHGAVSSMEGILL